MNQTDLKKFLTKAHACVPIFIALGDESRQKLFIDIAMSEDEGLNVNTLTEKSHLSRPAISYHLKMLKSAGLIKANKKGTQIFYTADRNSKQTKFFRETISFFNNIIELAYKKQLNT